jgi:hypothetical protein
MKKAPPALEQAELAWRSFWSWFLVLVCSGFVLRVVSRTMDQGDDSRIFSLRAVIGELFRAVACSFGDSHGLCDVLDSFVPRADAQSPSRSPRGRVQSMTWPHAVSSEISSTSCSLCFMGFSALLHHGLVGPSSRLRSQARACHRIIRYSLFCRDKTGLGLTTLCVKCRFCALGESYHLTGRGTG